MSRGQRREAIVRNDRDRTWFLETMDEACERCGWVVHAWVLMTNHYHWLLETPEPNLVRGMQWFQTTWSTRFRNRHGLSGHVLQGRYKSPVVDPGSMDYFQRISSYIHLNPVRAKGLLGPEDPLKTYRWSSFGSYVGAPSRRPPWLCVERVLGNLGLEDTRRDRRLYGEHVEGLVAVERGHEGRKAAAEQRAEWKHLRRGWYFGTETFRDQMLEKLDAFLGSKARGSYGGEAVRAHDKHAAEELVKRAFAGLELDEETLSELKKTDARKRVIAWALRTRTHVRNRWISERLEMGHDVNVSQSVRLVREGTTPELRRLRARLVKTLNSKD
jgi:REP element-mobilizing transposase RayT